MVKEVLVDENTRWKCIGSGRCCHLIGKENTLQLFQEETKQDGACPKLDEKNRCSIYSDRPLGCKMYPFYPDWNKLKQGNVDFSEGSLKIDSECPGYGQGEFVLKDVHLKRKLEKISQELKDNIRKKPSGKIKDLFTMA